MNEFQAFQQCNSIQFNILSSLPKGTPKASTPTHDCQLEKDVLLCFALLCLAKDRIHISMVAIACAWDKRWSHSCPFVGSYNPIMSWYSVGYPHPTTRIKEITVLYHRCDGSQNYVMDGRMNK